MGKALVGARWQNPPKAPENLEIAAISDKVIITPVGTFQISFANIESGPHIHGPSKSAPDISKFNDHKIY